MNATVLIIRFYYGKGQHAICAQLNI